MSKARKYPVPDYKVPAGMRIVGFLNKHGKFYYKYGCAARYNAGHNGSWVNGRWSESADPFQLPDAVYALVSD